MSVHITLFKTAGALTIAGGSGVAGYIYRHELAALINSDNKVFLVNANDVDANIEDINSGHNYCALNKEIDTDCKILSLNFNEQKYIEPQNIVSSTTLAKKLTNNSFYKLIVNRWKIKSLVDITNTTIVVKNGSGQNSKDVAKLKIISTMYESTNEKPVDSWSGSKLLVQADKTVTEEIELTEKCKFVISDAETTSLKCSIYKFDNHPSGKQILDFTKITKLTKFNEVQAGQYYILDFDFTENNTAIKKINDENLKKIFIKKDNSTNVALSFKSKIITNLKEETTDYSNNQALFLTNNFQKNTSNSTYLITKSQSVSETGFAEHKTNYKCELSNTTDTNCVIIGLTDEEKTLLNITDAQTIPTSINAADKYYKVITNNEIIKKITDWNSTAEISIKSKATNNTTEYGKLKPIFSIENGKIVKGKTTLVIATAKEAITTQTTISDSTQFQCAIDDSTSFSDCDVYKFSDKPFDATNDLEKLKTTLAKATKNEDWAQNKSFLINLKTPEIDHSKSTETKNVNVKVKVKSASTDIAKLAINTHLFSKTTFNGTSFTDLLMFV